MGIEKVYPQKVYDLSNYIGQDLALNPDRDLLNVSDVIRSQQRILRRLLTNPGDYIWETGYGAGLPAYIGQPLSNDNRIKMESSILAQIFLEDSVAKSPAPVIAFQTIFEGIIVQIDYTIASIGQPVVLTFVI